MWDWWMGILPSRDLTYCSNDWDIIYYQTENYLIVICESLQSFFFILSITIITLERKKEKYAKQSPS